MSDRTPQSVLAQVVDIWASHQQALLDTIRPLSDEQMGLSVPGAWPIWRLVGNIAGGRVLWFHRLLGESDLGHASLLALGGWDDGTAYARPAGELVDAIERSWLVVRAAVERWSADDLDTDVHAVDWRGEPISLQRAHVVADLMTHDAHHGSEISLILRAHGLPTALNQ